MQKRRIASWKQNLEYINILQESCKMETLTEIESLQGPTTLYGRLLIVHAAITEMIKVQFTTITDRIKNKIRNGNWFLKFSINRKEQKCLPIYLRLLTLLTIIKDPSSDRGSKR
jgi:hypothetical protein